MGRKQLGQNLQPGRPREHMSANCSLRLDGLLPVVGSKNATLKLLRDLTWFEFCQ